MFEAVMLLLSVWSQLELIDYNFAEIINLKNLERVLAREEEVKKSAIVRKAVFSGPQIQYFSKDGKLTIII
jgi:hypothetical protein